MKRGQKELYETLEKLEISFDFMNILLNTIEDYSLEGFQFRQMKNIFFRNHKGNRHYLVILEHLRQLNIHDLEKRLRQGKLTFASDKRLMRYLGVEPGSVSPFGLINDTENHVHLFIDEHLGDYERLAFHPNVNTASLVISKTDFIRFLEFTGNSYEFIKLYD